MLKRIPGSSPTLVLFPLFFVTARVLFGDGGTAGTVCHADPLKPPFCLEQQLELLSHRLLKEHLFVFYLFKRLEKTPYSHQRVCSCE